MPPTPSAAQSSSAKRKRPQQHQPGSVRKKPRPSVQDARVIASQTSGKAFGGGELHVDKFVAAHEFEIRALEDGMRRAKRSLTTRAFQNVPRELRRRTASHNVKRVPKRLRTRAHREMTEDNTPTVTAKKRKPTSHMRLRLESAKQKKQSKPKQDPVDKGEDEAQIANGSSTAPSKALAKPLLRKTGVIHTREPRVKKNTLQRPPQPKARFRKRQIHKAWLPTHLFHAKRAHMTPPKEPLWRMAIPLSPTAKSYRPIHRASSARGAVAWDMSYMSTIGLEGPEKSIIGLIKALGVGKDEGVAFWEKKATRWLNGTRSWDGWLYERGGWPKRSIAPATVIWCAKQRDGVVGQPDMDVSAKPESKLKRKVLIRVHPSAFLELWEEVLRLSKVQKPAVAVEDLRFEIGSIELVGPASTEALVGVLRPSKTHSTLDGSKNEPEDVWNTLGQVANPASLPANALLAMDVSDPRLHHPRMPGEPPLHRGDDSGLLHMLASWPVDKSQTAAKLFDRTARLAAARQLPSQKAINRRKTLAEVGQHPAPVSTDPMIPVLLLATRGQGGGQGSWTLLLPWKCVLPVWYSLLYYPLSTGGNIRFGGLDQKRQISFETGTPWFPADHPGTKAGLAWEVREREKRKKEWESRPKGKRVEFDSLKLGGGRTGEVGLGWSCDWESIVGPPGSGQTPTVLHRIPKAIVEQKLKSHDNSMNDAAKDLDGGLFAVKLTLLGRGIPTTCARIYRLPTTNPNLAAQWSSLLLPTNNKAHSLPPRDAPPHIQQRHLAASLLDPPDEPAPHPESPDEQDLIGFVTTGNFNLGEGKGTGLGCLFLAKVLEGEKERKPGGAGKGARLCVVREAGQVVGRLARWEVV